MKVTCKYCGKSKGGVSPSNIKDPSDYHCVKCRGKYLKEYFEKKRKRGELTFVRGRQGRPRKKEADDIRAVVPEGVEKYKRG